MLTKTPRYTVRKYREKDDKRFGPYHASYDGYAILCDRLKPLKEGNWWIESNNFDGEVTCKKCIKILNEASNDK